MDFWVILIVDRIGYCIVFYVVFICNLNLFGICMNVSE